jgi:hypothetical protein
MEWCATAPAECSAGSGDSNAYRDQTTVFVGIAGARVRCRGSPRLRWFDSPARDATALAPATGATGATLKPSDRLRLCPRSPRADRQLAGFTSGDRAAGAPAPETAGLQRDRHRKVRTRSAQKSPQIHEFSEH